MFQPHDEFKQIEDTAILWRYVDLPRYLDLLLKQQLFFCRADKFEDPFEGQYTLQSKEELLKEQMEKVTGYNGREEIINKVKEEIEHLEEEHIAKRTFVTINSWHYNTYENYAMWKIYAKGTYGIAIQTTYERLKRSFDTTDKTVFIGKVAYYDTDCEPIPFRNTLLPFFRKRNIYQYENEVRCCHVIPHEDEVFGWQEQDADDGIFVNVDLNVLIERIYISPYSPKWIRDIVAGINEKFNIDKEIVHSTVFDSKDY
jgi:hypothetical protein